MWSVSLGSNHVRVEVSVGKQDVWVASSVSLSLYPECTVGWHNHLLEPVKPGVYDVFKVKWAFNDLNFGTNLCLFSHFLLLSL